MDSYRKSSAFDWEKKKKSHDGVRLQKTYLYDGAFSRILPNCPLYSSSLTTSWESPDTRRILLLKVLLNQRITDDLAYKQQKKSYNIGNLKGKFNFLDRNYYSVV